MSLNVKKTKDKTHIDINKKEFLRNNIIMLILLFLFIILFTFLYFNKVPEDQKNLFLISSSLVLLLTTIVILLQFKARLFIEKDLLKNSFLIVIPSSFPIGNAPSSIIHFSNSKKTIKSQLLYIEAKKARGYMAHVEKVFTLYLVFKNEEVTLFSPEWLALGSHSGSTIFRVTKEEAEEIARVLGVKIKFSYA